MNEERFIDIRANIDTANPLQTVTVAIVPPPRGAGVMFSVCEFVCKQRYAKTNGRISVKIVVFK